VQDPPQFAHPVEATFARILDYYGVEWVYEPRTFALEWDDEGNVTVAFAPDFYLPQQDLYIELTTLRPQLIRHKNRKMRRMQELYPEINIKLLKRQDIRDMMVKFGLDQEANHLVGTEAQTPR
jgi:hypoxanthine phosphoribosyltransferase